MTAGDPLAWAGPWAEDVKRVFTLLQEQAPEGEHPAECAYCPVCRGIALVRDSGPELLDRVAELAAGLAATLRETRDTRGTREAPGEPPSTGTAPQPPTTVRIDVTD